MPKRRFLLFLPAAALVAACKLIDQTTFAPDPLPATPKQVAAVDQSERPPLLTIRYDVPNPSYEDLLNYAVQNAERRNRSIAYQVVSVVPARGSPEAATEEALKGRNRAVEVMQAIMRLGVPDSRITLGARADPAATAPEVRVYVR